MSPKNDVYEYNGRSSRTPEIPEPEVDSNVDAFMDVLGNPGRFQMLQFVLLSMLFIACAMNDLAPIFYDVQPHRVDCIVSNVTRHPDQLWNDSSSWWHKTDGCQRYCPGDDVTYKYFYGDDSTVSVVADLNLICDKHYLISLAATIYFVGCAVGGPTFGILADRFGRRRALVLANILYTLFTVALIFAQDIIVFMVLRFFIGFARQGLQACFLVLMLEWTHPAQRSRIGAATQFFYVAGVLLLALFSFLFPNWRHLQIVIACANVSAVTFYWMAPESMQWLLMNGRKEQAEANAVFVAKFNGLQLHHDDMALLERLADEEMLIRTSSAGQKAHSILDCFKTKKVAILMLLSCFIWFVANSGYMGISFMIADISKELSPQANLAIAGSLEAIPTALTIPLVSRFGRRFPMASYFTVATIFLVAAGSLSADNPAQTYLAMVGRMAIVGSFSIIYVWGTEIFPTVIRNQGFGVLSLAFMVGGMVAPQILLLGEALGYASGQMVIPIVVFACFTFLAAVSALILPETKNRRLPETMQDIQDLPYGFKNKCMGR